MPTYRLSHCSETKNHRQCIRGLTLKTQPKAKEFNAHDSGSDWATASNFSRPAAYAGSPARYLWAMLLARCSSLCR
jgi:hypothetical protein